MSDYWLNYPASGDPTQLYSARHLYGLKWHARGVDLKHGDPAIFLFHADINIPLYGFANVLNNKGAWCNVSLIKHPPILAQYHAGVGEQCPLPVVHSRVTSVATCAHHWKVKCPENGMNQNTGVEISLATDKFSPYRGDGSKSIHLRPIKITVVLARRFCIDILVICTNTPWSHISPGSAVAAEICGTAAHIR